MNIYAGNKDRVNLPASICILVLCAALIIFSESCSQGAVNGIEMCLSVLVPSLFPFMALSSFIVKSGLSQTLGKPFRPVMNKIFGLDACYAPVLLLSLIGGYPLGARGIAELYESGQTNLHQAKKAALTAVCAGPGFMINYIGGALYGNSTIGFIILISQIISVLLLAFTVNLFDKSRNEFISNSEYKEISPDITNSVVTAAYDSARGILNICIFVVLFSAFTSIIENLTDINLINYAVKTLLEVCSAVNALSADCPVEAVAFAAGFGGLCVHFQIFSSLGKIKVNKSLFFVIRIIQGVITSLLTHIGMIIFSEDVAVFSTGSVEKAQASGGNIISSAVLVGVMICFLFTFKNYRNKHN